MYSILLSLTLSLLLGFSGVFLDWWHWGWGIFFTLLLSVVIWVLIARRVGKQIQPAMEQVQRQMQQGHVKLAIQTLEDMLPLGKWVPMLHGQVIAQMGMLEYYQGDKERGVGLTGLREESIQKVGMQEQAAITLADIAHNNGSMQDAIIDAGGVPPLLTFIRMGSQLGQEHAARAVWHLAEYNEHQPPIVEAGAVADLVQLLKTGSPRAAEFAAAGLMDLARGVALNEHLSSTPSQSCPPGRAVNQVGSFTSHLPRWLQPRGS